MVITASRIATEDADATFATEVHSREDIERSGASSLFDYLARNTSVQVRPRYGNSMAPAIDVRGYGLGDGYQNVVISIDGRRMNNIDMTPQLVGSIPLSDIERIEITKGSGSVIYGDGAMAGSIQIITKPRSGASVSGYLGSDDSRGASVSVGAVHKRLSVSAALDHATTDGAKDPDSSGHTNESESNTWRAALSGKPLDGLELEAKASHTYFDTRYVGKLTNAEFRRDPAQDTGSDYTWQQVSEDVWGLGAEFELADGVKLRYSHSELERDSVFVNSGYATQVDSTYDEISAHGAFGPLELVVGWQSNDSERMTLSNRARTAKKNDAAYIQANATLGALTLSAGGRREVVSYSHKPLGAVGISDDHKLYAWDIGANVGITDAWTVFANYNSAYQAPDVDRFFRTNFSTGVANFNGFIEPAEVKTFNLGTHWTGAGHRIKANVFHARLKNEIYYDQGNFTNTNLDRSHKYGFEFQDHWQLTQTVAGVLNYTWVRAKIDREDGGNGAYDGKDLPGVPTHGLLIGGDWQFSERSNIRLTHTWRSQTWAIGDFENNNNQKQGAYNSTDVLYRYEVKALGAKRLMATLGVNNLFEARNGIWTRDDSIYPTDFKRTWRIGVQADF